MKTELNCLNFQDYSAVRLSAIYSILYYDTPILCLMAIMNFLCFVHEQGTAITAVHLLECDAV
jgi:hypothetical protein